MKKTTIWSLFLSAVFLIQFGFQPAKGENDEKVNSSNNPPFGTFETPSDGANVSSSVAFTGWALDDAQIESVKIYLLQNNLQFVGDATFVEGARPDVAAIYPTYPNNTRAGWGYMMLTNFLPDGGNGNYTFCAIAKDNAGLEISLGTKSIFCDNAHAVKPFGAIDTPIPGETVSGNIVIQGWVLTPPPNKVLEDGTTIRVIIDGTDVGKAHYNIYRQDIASLFPGYANSNGALAYFELDTQKYINGLHTVAWVVTDNAGHTDGVGSRYFSILNEGNDGRTEKLDGVITVRFPVGSISSFQPVTISKTSDPNVDELLNGFSKALFEVCSRLSYEIRINTGSELPQDNIEIMLNIPASFLNSIPIGYRIDVFAQVYQDGGMGVIDGFDLFQSDYNSSTKILSAEIPNWVFTNMRTSDNSYEAILTVVATPEGSSDNPLDSKNFQNSEDEGCTTTLFCPLQDCQLNPERTFHRDLRKHITKKQRPHLGIDLYTRVNGVPTENFPVYPAADGKFEGAFTLAEAGKCIVIRHADGSATFYAHLKLVINREKGKEVFGKNSANPTIIGYTGSTGISSGPHLHFGYVSRGDFLKKNAANYQDPWPCIVDKPFKGENSFVFNGSAYKFDENNCKIIYAGASSIHGISIEDSNYKMTITFEANSIGAYNCCIPPLVSVYLSYMNPPNKIYEVSTGTIRVTTYDEVNGVIAGVFEGTGLDMYNPDPLKGFNLSGKFYAKKEY